MWIVERLLLQLLLLARKQRVNGRIKLVPALEEIEFENENIAHDSAAELCHERSGCRCRATCGTSIHGCLNAICGKYPTGCNDVIDDKHFLPRLHGVGLHLEEIGAVLLLVLCSLTRTRQLAPLPDGHESGSQSQREAGAKQKSSGVQSDNDVRLAPAALLYGQLQRPKQSLVELGIRKDGQNVLEQNTGLREIGELAQGRLQLYLKTGEFGGGGGMGGGESSLVGIAL